jgi:hypothetical protein
VVETTTAPKTPATAANGTAPVRPDRPARAVDQTARTPDASGTSSIPGTPSTPSQPSYTLLSPPNYDNIVGGVSPSPFVAVLFLLGLVALIASAIGQAFGADMQQWWLLGGMLVVIATFLAGFVSRSA